ncbi:MAG: leucine-rich repeat domain-containing protein [Promethearchaeota archaeon]
MIIIEELKEYNGVLLVASETEFLEQIEKFIAEKIPCREDRDEAKRKVAESFQAYQPQTSQMSIQSILDSQDQAVKAQTAEQERLAQLSLEDLEKQYESQYLAQVNPTMQASLQAQLKSLVPMLGEEHPSVKQIKAMLEMDEDKAKQKAKAMAIFMQQNFKLQAVNKEATRRINDVMFSQIPFEELEKECINYYNSMITPEYQTQLKETIEVGIQVLGENDPTFAGLKPVLGMSEELAMQFAKQYAQSIFQNIQNILAQYGVQMQTSQQVQQQAMQPVQQVSEQSASVSHFGFISDNQHIIGLNIGWKDLDLLPDSIGNLTNLRFLDLSQNKLESLPESFGNLHELEELDLNGTWSTNDDKPLYNEISELPKSFCELKKLKVFKCENNGLRILSDNFGQLTLLTEVSLSQNRLSRIPDSIGELSDLKSLNLNSNRISSIPLSLCRLTKLNQLQLSFNLINEIPDCIEQLKSLSWFLLMNNKITELPPSIANLDSLETLWLSNNQISELPEAITEMKLSDLDISNNQLSTLPYFIWTMKSLRKLKVMGNPLSEEEQEIAQRDTDAILEYCRQRTSIAIMLMHTEIDAEAHRIPELIEYLENKSEIFAILPPIESNLTATDLILFLATARSINSPNMVQILKNAKSQGIEVVPLKGLDVSWADLAVVDLSRELGHEFTPNDFTGFCENTYSYIQQLKRSHNIFKDKTNILLKEIEAEVGDTTSFGTFKAELNRIIHLNDMKDFFEKNQVALTTICTSLQSAKVGGEGLFLTQLSGYFMGFMQQKQAMKQYLGGGQT